MLKYAMTAPSQSSAITCRPTTGVTGRPAPNLWGPIQFGNKLEPNFSFMADSISAILSIASELVIGLPSGWQQPRATIVNLFPL